MKSLRILIVMIEPPLPFGHASARWFYVLLKGLVERGHRVTAFATCSKVEEMVKAHDLFPPPTYDLRLYAHPERGGIVRKWKTLRCPYSYMFSSELRSDLTAEAYRGFDVLHLESIWSGWLGKNFNSSKVVLNFHSLYDIDQLNQPTRGLSDWLHRSLRRKAEHHLLRSYPTLLTLTPRLKDGVRAIAPKPTVHVVPLGLDLTLYPFISAERRSSEAVISIIGSMSWYPSRSAAVRLLTKLWPTIKERVPTAKVQIVGWNARHALSDCLAQPDVEVIEDVPDMRPYFEQAGVLLYAPRQGSGMKVKILEAFAYGVPVVTTSEGIEGLPAEDGVHASVCDDDAGLIQRTVALLGDRAQQEQQRRAARELLETHCSTKATLDGVERCYADLLTRRENINV